MADPVPKPAAQRRRRNVAAGRTKLPARGSGRRAPALPKADPPFLEATKGWWRLIWASPMASVYLPADVPALTRLAMLMNKVYGGYPSADDLREVRALEDRFGLSPLARRRLEWEVEQDNHQRAAAPVEAQKDRWLRVAN